MSPERVRWGWGAVCVCITVAALLWTAGLLITAPW